jgi:hypothetical protein
MKASQHTEGTINCSLAMYSSVRSERSRSMMELGGKLESIKEL